MLNAIARAAEQHEKKRNGEHETLSPETRKQLAAEYRKMAERIENG